MYLSEIYNAGKKEDSNSIYIKKPLVFFNNTEERGHG